MSEHSEHQEQLARTYDKTFFGFWVYLMTDLIMFAVLFAVYAVLHTSTFGGESAHELFSLSLAMNETLLLLTSSFTCGLGVIAARSRKKTQAIIWLLITFLLGLAFLGLELSEFAELIAEGNGPQRSAFLSSFFTLVGTHGLHITSGLLWLLVLFFYIFKRGLNDNMVRKITLFGVFWHFLDIVWIFIFTVVYLFAYLNI